ncbi:MAG: hypothetical protein SGPRY_000108 [Prymnesium sp.]
MRRGVVVVALTCLLLLLLMELKLPLPTLRDLNQPSSPEVPLNPPTWSIDDSKKGAGVLFFAYGASRTLNHFLKEAENAARTFRRHNPGIAIAVVTNNLTVNFSIFNLHIQPRADLMFAGEGRRADKIPRQWLTRLYYMAHSPFYITWALDSNVISCSNGAAQAFLDAALQTNLWGFDIASGSQNLKSSTLYPHNWNLAYRWGPRTANLMRDWLTLQIRQGVASDDQSTLHMALMRFLKQSGVQLKVGVVTPSFGLAWQTIVQTERRHVRMTPPVAGAAHVLHSTNLSHCAVVNEHAHRWRRIVGVRVEGRERPRRFMLQPVVSEPECLRLLSGVGEANVYCKLPADEPSTSTFEWPPVGVVAASVEQLDEFTASKRCSLQLCGITNHPRSSSLPLGHEMEGSESGHRTNCQPAEEKAAHYLNRHRVSCPAGSVLASFGLTRSGCFISERRRYTYSCIPTRAVVPATRNESGSEHSSERIVTMNSTCAHLRGRSIDALEPLKVRCPAGALLQSFEMAKECQEDGHMQYRYTCVWLERSLSATTEHHTLCSSTQDHNASAMEWHRLACNAGSALSGFDFSRHGCGVDGMTGRSDGKPMRYLFRCSPVPVVHL